MQILPVDFAKELVGKMIGVPVEDDVPVKEETIPMQPEPVQASEQAVMQPPPPQQEVNNYAQTPVMQPQMDYGYQQTAPVQNYVKVQPAQFSSFDSSAARQMQVPENIDIIKDVMLQITVELGKTVKPIDEILDFKPGSVLELDKVVGESLDILANGKKIAMGEVVVIDENYGIRITDIVKPDKRLQSL